ncbi:hypothetical protein E3N88_34463 [Mikania micrantha]|uniref:Glycine-rich protein n=1 Tax=Mikania micrantha TaxID=192012 RepID=A0A5N6M0U3_9ASTR|nr:hypothetical protein E3N88_34463 [Mikania micrantha]
MLFSGRRPSAAATAYPTTTTAERWRFYFVFDLLTGYPTTATAKRNKSKMVSKKFLLFGLAFAIVLLITSEIVAAKELASNHEGEVGDAKYDDPGYYNGGRGGYNGGGMVVVAVDVTTVADAGVAAL